VQTPVPQVHGTQRCDREETIVSDRDQKEAGRDMASSEELDRRTLRCKRLGHEVSLHYCRTLEADKVCPEIRNCWWQHVDIDALLQNYLSPRQLDQLRRHSPPSGSTKVVTLMDLIQQARELQATKESSPAADTGTAADTDP
jgi:hypothetical protein